MGRIFSNVVHRIKPYTPDFLVRRGQGILDRKLIIDQQEILSWPLNTFRRRLSTSSKWCSHYADMISADEGGFRIYPYDMDLKQMAVARTLLLDPGNAMFVSEPKEADCCVLREFASRDLIKIHKRYRIPFYVIIDNNDWGRDRVFLHDDVIGYIRRHDISIVYIKLQIYDRSFYQNYRSSVSGAKIAVLSMPMIFGGSKKHIATQKDYEGSALFEKVCCEESNQCDGRYEFDWSFIGSITSEDRRMAADVLSGLHDEAKERSFFAISTPNFSSADAATVPYSRYMQIVRGSKINLSLNGYGLWCTRDGELFAIKSFFLRQYHPCLNINELTPKDGLHWSVFRNDELKEKVEYYIQNDKEREEVRKRGFQYFRGMVEGNCARHYLSRVREFFDTGNERQFDGIAL